MAPQGVFVATELFADVLDGARIVKVDPNACIPFVNVRDVVRSGIRRLKRSFSCGEEGNLATRAVSGGSLPTVVEMTGTLRHVVVEYFIETYGVTHEEALLRSKARKKWYGIVDGNHRLKVLWELQEEQPERWQGFQWCVMQLLGGKSPGVLRAFARAQNLKQRDDHFVETTFYDMMKGLQDEASRMAIHRGGKMPTGQDLADHYCGNSERTSQSLRQLANLSLRLSPEVVEEIGMITNTECPELACSLLLSAGNEKLTPDNASALVDCRIYRNFLAAFTLKQASAFMQAKGDDADVLRINTLHRVKELSRQHGFKSVPYRFVNEQFVKACAALSEARKFEGMLESDMWPKGMEILRVNLLRNLVLDDEVEDNLGNDHQILPSLLERYRNCCPQQAPLAEAKFRIKVDKAVRPMISEEGGVNEQSPTGVMPSTPQGTRTGEMFGEGRDGIIAPPPTPPPSPEKDATLALHFKLLDQLGINCHSMSWQSYDKTVRVSDDVLFDMILTEPPSGLRRNAARNGRGYDDTMDVKEMQEFVKFARRVLFPGGYVVLFTSAKMFREWVREFRDADMSCVDYPFVMCKNTTGLQRNNRILFPQQVCDLAVVAVAPGKHPKGFKVNFTAPYNTVPCGYKRKFAAIDNIPVVKKKLRYDGSKAVVRVEEKNPDVLAELLVTFSPDTARILDPFAGTLSTGAACMATGRKCTLIERDEECFRLAFDNLGSLSRMYVGSPAQRMVARNRLRRNGKSVDYGESSDESFRTEEGCNDGEQDEEDFFGDEEEPHASEQDCILRCESAEKDVGEGSCADNPLDINGLCDLANIPHPPSSPRVSAETPTQVMDTTAGLCGRVSLLVDGAVVGTAEVQKDGNPAIGNKTVLHGESLVRYEVDDQRLVVVWRVEINPNCAQELYPYSYGGTEAPVRTLGQMCDGFYAWDLNAMATI